MQKHAKDGRHAARPNGTGAVQNVRCVLDRKDG